MIRQSLQLAKPQSLFFKALSNPARISIVNLLRHGPKSVGQICGELGFEQTMISHHLKCLSFCGFVTSERRGKSKVYSLNKETILPILELVEQHLEKFASNLYECDVLER